MSSPLIPLQRESYLMPDFRHCRHTAMFCALLVSFASFGALPLWADEPVKKVDGTPPVAEPFPLGTLMRVLEQDLSSKEYREVVDTMIPTDLAAEWKRVAVPDNAEEFLHAHGGKEAVLKDPLLAAAYNRRQKIATDFLELMRQEYKKRKKPAPFDTGEVIDYLHASATAKKFDPAQSLPIRPVLTTNAAASEWPRFRGPSGQGTATPQDFPLEWDGSSKNVVWKTELPGPSGASPVIWGDQIFVTADEGESHERLLLCYSRATGKLLWKQAAPQPVKKEKLYWKNSYASGTPVTDGEHVFAFFGNSGLLCYDMTGKQLWHLELGELKITYGPGTSPLLYKDKVICIQDQNQGESLFVAVDKLTGKKLWQKPRDKSMGWSTPVVVRVGDHDELIYNGSSKVTGYNPDTGEILWTVTGSSIESVPTAVIGGGLIFSTSGRNGPILAIRPGAQGDATESHVLWYLPRGGPHVPSPTYYDGRLYIISDTGILTCLDAFTGKTLWQERLRGRFTASAVESGGKLVLTNEAGLCYVVQAGPTYNLLATNDLGEDILSTPAILDGELFFRTKTALICIGKRKPTP